MIRLLRRHLNTEYLNEGLKFLEEILGVYSFQKPILLESYRKTVEDLAYLKSKLNSSDRILSPYTQELLILIPTLLRYKFGKRSQPYIINVFNGYLEDGITGMLKNVPISVQTEVYKIMDYVDRVYDGLGPKEFIDDLLEIYQHSGAPEAGMTFPCFRKAMVGYLNLLRYGYPKYPTNYLIVDYSLPVHVERGWVFNLLTGELIRFNGHTGLLVAHGKDTGRVFAYRFGNRTEHMLSSLGLKITKRLPIFLMDDRLVLRFAGVEKGINDMDGVRGLRIEGVSIQEDHLQLTDGSIGIQKDVSKQVVKLMMNQRPVFVYYNDMRNRYKYDERSMYQDVYAAAQVFSKLTSQ